MAETITISLNELRPGIVLPSAIFDGNNPDLLLLGKGVRVTKQNVDRLLKRGITSISIDKSFADQISKTGGSPKADSAKEANRKLLEQQREKEDAEILAKAPLIQQMNQEDRLSYDDKKVEKLREKRAAKGKSLKQFFDQATLPGLREGKQISGIAVEAVEDMVSDMDVFVKLALDSNGENDDHSHCVRVSELAMAIAAVMEFPRSKIEELGVGCLIYRAAMSQRACALRDKERELNAIERLEFTKNPKLMFEALKDVADLPAGARQVAYQIYERWDGTGYPRQRLGQQIHPLARIAMVADVFVALTSDRPHRAAFEPYRAVLIMLEDTKKRKFDPKVIKAFLQTVCLYPIGSYVELSDGSTCVVVRTNIDFFDKPIVQVIFNDKGKRIVPRSVDLSQETELQVATTIESDIVEAMVIATEKSFTCQKTFVFDED